MKKLLLLFSMLLTGCSNADQPTITVSSILKDDDFHNALSKIIEDKLHGISERRVLAVEKCNYLSRCSGLKLSPIMNWEYFLWECRGNNGSVVTKCGSSDDY